MSALVHEKLTRVWSMLFSCRTSGRWLQCTAAHTFELEVSIYTRQGAKQWWSTQVVNTNAPFCVQAPFDAVPGFLDVVVMASGARHMTQITHQPQDAIDIHVVSFSKILDKKRRAPITKPAILRVQYRQPLAVGGFIRGIDSAFIIRKQSSGAFVKWSYIHDETSGDILVHIDMDSFMLDEDKTLAVYVHDVKLCDALCVFKE